MHQPRLTDKNTPHIFNNRWPRDAALKAASRSDMYPDDSTICMIYLREIGPEVTPANYDLLLLSDGQSGGGVWSERLFGGQQVHVYRGWRTEEVAPDIPKFGQVERMWVARVEKVREEKLLDRKSLL